MIRLLSFLFLVAVVSAETQKCGDSSYTSFVGDLPSDVPTDQAVATVCECLKKLLLEKQTTAVTIDCKQNDAIATLQWAISPYIDDPSYANCLSGLENASSDPAKVCQVVGSTSPVTVPPAPTNGAVALRIRIIIIIVIRPGRITIGIGIQW